MPDQDGGQTSRYKNYIKSKTNMPVSRNQELGFRKSHAFVIGIDEYRALNSNLKTAVKDSIEIAKRLKALQGFDNVLLLNNVGKAQIETLLHWLKDEYRSTRLQIEDQTFDEDRSAYSSSISYLKTKREVEETAGLDYMILDWEKDDGTSKREHLYYVKETDMDIQPEDSIVFYYAGHGFPGEFKDGPAGYLAPTDAQNKQVDNESLLPMDEVYKALSKLKCKHTLLILDCCFAGKFRFSSLTRAGRKPFAMPMYKRRYERYKSSQAWQVLVSAGPDQTANDSAKWAKIRDHSPFAKTLMDALEGKADARTMSNKTQGDGIITAHELYLFIWEQVEAITAKRKVQHPGLFPMKEHREGEFIFINPNISADAFKFAKDPDRNPYKGLVSYEPEDANLFFGREAAIASLLRMVPFQAALDGSFEKKMPPTVIFITAPSAAGKSSVVKAGLFPNLQKQYGYEELLIFRPAANIQGQSILPDEVEHKGEYKRESWTGFAGLKARLKDRNKRQVILLDQFETFFTELTQSNEQSIFQEELFGIIEDPADEREQPLLLIITVRTDVEWMMSNAFGVNRKEVGSTPYWRTENIFRLQPMNLDELRGALTGPAWWALHDFKDTLADQHTDDGEELINQILKDVMYFPAALPLLSCVMQRFYERAKEKNRKQRLIKEDYDNSAGVAGALSANAEQFYQQQDAPTQALMRRILMRMVQPGDAGYFRRRVTYFEMPQDMSEAELADFREFGPLSQLDYPIELDYAKDNQALKKLIDDMEAAHLVVQDKNADGIPIVEPAHDALINHWPRCLEWIQDFGLDNLNLQRQLWQAVVDARMLAQRDGALEIDVMRMGAALPEGYDQEEDVLTASSNLWDNSPKLQQVLHTIDLDQADHVSEPVTIARFEHSLTNQLAKREAAKKKEQYYSELFSQLSEEDLENRFLEADHWLNLAEIYFVLESWARKEDRYKQIKKERDEAIAAKKRAEEQTAIAIRQADMAESRRLSTVAAQVLETGQLTEALQIALAAYRKADYPPPAVAYQTLLAVFSTGYNGCIPIKIGADLSYMENMETCSIFSSDGSFVVTSRGTDYNPYAVYATASDESISGFFEVRFFAKGQKILTSRTASRRAPPRVQIWDRNFKELAVMEHPHLVWDLVISPDEKMILTGFNDKMIKLWDTEGRLIADLEGHTDRITSFEFSPDGQHILTVSKDKSTKLWNKQGSFLQDLSINEVPTISAKFSPDSQYLLTIAKDQTAKLCDLNGMPVVELTLADKQSIALQQQHLLVKSAGTIKILDFAGSLLAELVDIELVEFSADGQKIMALFANGQIKLLDLQAKVLAELTKPHSSPPHVKLSPDREKILVISENQVVKLWNFKGEVLARINHDNVSGKRIDFSPNGELIRIVTESGEPELWDLKGNLLADFQQLVQDGVDKLLISQNGKRLLTTSEEGTQLWRFEHNLLRTLDHSAAVQSVAFSPGGEQILSVSRESVARLWDLSGKLLLKLDKEQLGARANLVFSPDGERIINFAKSVKIWDLKGKLIKTLTQPQPKDSFRYSGQFSPDGTLLLTDSYGLPAKLWDLDGRLLATLEEFYSAAFSSDSQRILTQVKTAKLWDLKGNVLAELKHDKYSVKVAAFSLPDAKYIFTCSDEHVAKLWNSDGEPLKDLPHTNRVRSVTFSPDGRRMVTFSLDSPARLWDMEGNLLGALGKDRWSTPDVVFSPDGQRILLPGKTTELYDSDGKLLQKIPGNFATSNFFSDGKSILISAETTQVWNLDGHKLADFGKKLQEPELSPDGQYIINSFRNKQELRDLNGDLLIDFGEIGTKPIKFSPDGQRMLTRTGTQASLWPAPNLYAQWVENLGLTPLTNEKREEYGLGLS